MFNRQKYKPRITTRTPWKALQKTKSKKNQSLNKRINSRIIKRQFKFV